MVYLQGGEEESSNDHDLISVQTSPKAKGREKEGERSEEKMKKTLMTKYERAKILGTRALQIRSY